MSAVRIGSRAQPMRLDIDPEEAEKEWRHVDLLMNGLRVPSPDDRVLIALRETLTCIRVRDEKKTQAMSRVMSSVQEKKNAKALRDSYCGTSPPGTEPRLMHMCVETERLLNHQNGAIDPSLFEALRNQLEDVRNELFCSEEALIHQEVEIATLRAKAGEYEVQIQELKTELRKTRSDSETAAEALKHRFQEHERDEAHRQLLQAEIDLLKHKLSEIRRIEAKKGLEAEESLNAELANAAAERAELEKERAAFAVERAAFAEEMAKAKQALASSDDRTSSNDPCGDTGGVATGRSGPNGDVESCYTKLLVEAAAENFDEAVKEAAVREEQLRAQLEVEKAERENLQATLDTEQANRRVYEEAMRRAMQQVITLETEKEQWQSATPSGSPEKDASPEKDDRSTNMASDTNDAVSNDAVSDALEHSQPTEVMSAAVALIASQNNVARFSSREREVGMTISQTAQTRENAQVATVQAESLPSTSEARARPRAIEIEGPETRGQAEPARVNPTVQDARQPEEMKCRAVLPSPQVQDATRAQVEKDVILQSSPSAQSLPTLEKSQSQKDISTSSALQQARDAIHAAERVVKGTKWRQTTSGHQNASGAVGHDALQAPRSSQPQGGIPNSGQQQQQQQK
eukprot:gnl/MRDRNA2_/MRDRNA2_141611_c0_seq1.p1 gnl/MRDRNA2_/MRDRNA2_141611_c0~~gnl/MRDRNA2_/MRDRNA2_141611_c0_seq1.p1  ORF type:complete len:648 (-),score=170.12 gnl/MRDRNA2_/MRDRNA2_141611_c0_seq1:19-1917(-)